MRRQPALAVLDPAFPQFRGVVVGTKRDVLARSEQVAWTWLPQGVGHPRSVVRSNIRSTEGR
jgi:hypothetical protein